MGGEFGQLQKYAEDNGHARVPQSHEVLGSWVGVQRGLRAKGKVNPGYEDRLSNVKSWSWDPKTEQWEEAFRQLIEFAENHHHTRVPPAGPLGRWIIRQRQAYDQDKLDADRKDRLNELKAKGWWSWDPYADQWEEGFGYFQKHIASGGNARVSKDYMTDDGFRLGQWLAVERRNKKLDDDRKDRLSKLGWSLDLLADQWEEGFRSLVEYVESHDNARVPSTHKLAKWVVKQRVACAQGKLDADRKDRLSNVEGWSWDPDGDRWEQAFNRLLAYIKEFGNSLVPPGYTTADDGFGLGQWVKVQRKRYAANLLEEDRKARLSEVDGWEWKVKISSALTCPSGVQPA